MKSLQIPKNKFARFAINAAFIAIWEEFTSLIIEIFWEKIDEIELPIHISNISMMDPKDSKPTKIKYKFDKDKKIRIAKSSESQV